MSIETFLMENSNARLQANGKMFFDEQPVYTARGKSTLNLKGVIGRRVLLTTLTGSSTPRSLINIAVLLSGSASMRSVSVGIPRTATYLRLFSESYNRCSIKCLPAINPRKMPPRKIKKMQVPAYAPVLVGVHFEERKGVE
ncbi:MAG: hypothetical protein Q9169_007148 [Polycauliona sp. 2 TL-2023]